MNCIFCQSVSDSSKAVEHIIPESLGNKDHILPPGWVCDKCNHYFSIKIEKPFLDSLHLTEARFHMAVSNKRGRVPSIKGFHVQSLTKVELFHLPDGEGFAIGAAKEEDSSRWVKSYMTRTPGTIYLPNNPMPEICPTLARFVGKVGLEVLAHRALSVVGANNEITFKPELGDLRDFVRWNRGQSDWPISVRRIYPRDCLFCEPFGEPFEVLHEFDILVTSDSEYFVVFAIFGVEYAMNLAGPELDGYEKWLADHSQKSPLYIGKNNNKSRPYGHGRGGYI
jgi:hypothetical protein